MKVSIPAYDPNTKTITNVDVELNPDKEGEPKDTDNQPDMVE